MKKWLMMAAAAAMVSVGMGAAEAKDWDKIVIATEGAYPPFNMVDKDGNLTGFDVEFAKKLCETAGKECEIVAQDWDGIIPGLLAKKYDVIIAQMSITEERKRSIDFTRYYATTPAVFVAAEGKSIKAYANGEVIEGSLDGMVIGVQRATTHSNFLEDNFPNTEVRLYGSQDEANLDLTAGRIDATLADSGVLAEWLKTDEGKGFAFASDTFAPTQWFGEGAGMGIRQDEPELKKILEDALVTMLMDGSYWIINEKYFPGLSINLHPRP